MFAKQMFKQDSPSEDRWRSISTARLIILTHVTRDKSRLKKSTAARLHAASTWQ